MQNCKKCNTVMIVTLTHFYCPGCGHKEEINRPVKQLHNLTR